MLLASAYAVASRRGQHLALMMPLHSVRLRAELGARLTASSTEWTELVLLAKDLATLSGSATGGATGETTPNDAQYGSE